MCKNALPGKLNFFDFKPALLQDVFGYGVQIWKESKFKSIKNCVGYIATQISKWSTDDLFERT